MGLVMEETELSFDGLRLEGVEYGACSWCGYVGKGSKPKGLKDYYAKGWQSVSRSHGDAARWLTEAVEPHLASPVNSILDIGSRDSVFVDAVGENLKASDRSVFDPNTGGGFVGDSEFRPTRQYDLVTACHVLEHVPNLDTFLDDLQGMAKKFIFIEVPSPELESYSGGNDDISRTHLHHFTLTSLIELGATYDLYTLRVDSVEGDGLQSNRILFGLEPPDGAVIIRLVALRQKIAYRSAYTKHIRALSPKEYGLYGISDAYHKFCQCDPKVKTFPVFDLHRGSLEGIYDVKGVVITPRQYTSRVAIKKFLDERHVPWIDPWE